MSATWQQPTPAYNPSCAARLLYCEGCDKHPTAYCINTMSTPPHLFGHPAPGNDDAPPAMDCTAAARPKNNSRNIGSLSIESFL